MHQIMEKYNKYIVVSVRWLVHNLSQLFFSHFCLGSYKVFTDCHIFLFLQRTLKKIKRCTALWETYSAIKLLTYWLMYTFRSFKNHPHPNHERLFGSAISNNLILSRQLSLMRTFKNGPKLEDGLNLFENGRQIQC